MPEFITNDLSFSAYLSMHDIPLISAKRLGQMYKFVFEDNPEIRKLQLSYINSESSKFDDSVRKLKKIIFGDNGGNQRPY